MNGSQRVRERLLWEDERGFTLAEVLVTILVMGILLAIATSIWFGMVESRNVDSATNQLVADMRLAHSSATNQLTDWEVRMTSGSSTYQLVKLTSPEQVSTRSLPDGTVVSTTMNIRFKPDGSAEIVSGSGTQVTVSSEDGDPQHVVEFTLETSEVRIVS